MGSSASPPIESTAGGDDGRVIRADVIFDFRGKRYIAAWVPNPKAPERAVLQMRAADGGAMLVRDGMPALRKAKRLLAARVKH